MEWKTDKNQEKELKMAWGVSQIADLVIIIVDFLKKIEEIIDPKEKSTIEDTVLRVVGEIAERLAKD